MDTCEQISSMKPTIIYYERKTEVSNSCTKAMQTLALVRSAMVTVIVYSYFVKAVDYLKTRKNNIVGCLNKEEDNK